MPAGSESGDARGYPDLLGESRPWRASAVPACLGRARIGSQMFEEVESRLARLQRFLPLAPAAEARLANLLDPLFIYHSNALEGNTLSLADTVYFIEEDRAPAGKRGEELLEVKGQQAAVRYLHEAV